MRKLLILEYPNIKNLNLEDEAQFRNLILWLEEQKIRHYEIVDRTGLRDVKAQNWTHHFKTYLKDLEYPYEDQNRMIIVDWLAGVAVKLEFFDNGEKFRKCCASDVIKRRQNAESASTLKMLSAKDERLKKTIKEFAELLQIPPHYLNDEITLEAVKIFVQQRIESNLKKSAGDNNEKQMKLSVSDSRLQLGFTTNGLFNQITFTKFKSYQIRQ